VVTACSIYIFAQSEGSVCDVWQFFTCCEIAKGGFSGDWRSLIGPYITPRSDVGHSKNWSLDVCRSQECAAMKLKIAVILAFSWILPSLLSAQPFHNAPGSAAALANPVVDDSSAVGIGKRIYTRNCAQCHGANLQGTVPAPSLDSSGLRAAKPGEVFWFITNGSTRKGMPSWSQLSDQQRWQVVSFLQSRLSLEAKRIPVRKMP